MARRRRAAARSRTRTVTKYVRSRARGSNLKSLINPMVAGVVTGMAQSFIPNNALGGYGDSLVPIGVGYIMKDKALQTIGAYQLGIKLAGSIGAPASSLGGGSY